MAIVLRARITWLQAALSALLVGHGFVLAIDLFSAASRSAESGVLMRRELDPLLGIVRPTLGGLYLAISLLGPLVAVRALSIEKERGTFRALLLASPAPARLTATKLAAGLAGVSAQLLAPLLLLGGWALLGGHLAIGETLVSLGGYLLYIVLTCAIALAAAAWTETLAQAAVVTLVALAASWAIDASEGFAALAWLGDALDWSVTTHLLPAEHGTIAAGSVLWILTASAAALGLALIGLRFDWSRTRRATAVALVLLLSAVALSRAPRLGFRWDLTEDRRASLPRAAEEELRALPGRLVLEVGLDRDDARRRQLEADVLSKLRIARPDLELRYPLDARLAPDEASRDEDYGRIRIRLGEVEKETRSSSRKEIVSLIFEAAGRALPEWPESDYPGYPTVLDGAARSALVGAAYFGIPGALLLTGFLITRTKRRT